MGNITADRRSDNQGRGLHLYREGIGRSLRCTCRKKGGERVKCTAFKLCILAHRMSEQTVLSARDASLREAMSHAQTVWQSDDESLLSIGHMTYWLHTANAATVSEQSSRTCRHGLLRPSRGPFSGLVHLDDELLTEQRGAAAEPSLLCKPILIFEKITISSE